MKKVMMILVVGVMTTVAANAQVKLGFGIGYANPLGDISDVSEGGVAAYGELGYGFSDSFDVSLLYQGDFLASGSEENVSLEAITISNVMVNARYFIAITKFKPYVGLGVGLANVNQGSITSGNVTLDGVDESNFALRPSLGFKYGVLNVHAAYLNAGKIEDATISDFSINLGLLFTFGGGK